MRYLVPGLLFASPAVAHPAQTFHGHTADWAAPLVLLLIGFAAFVALRRAVRVQK